MHREDLKTAFLRSLSGLLTVGMAVGLFFLFQNLPAIAKWLGTIGTILRPFLLGCLFAYLLRKPCNFLMNRLTARMHSDRLKKTMNGVVVFGLMALLLLLIYWLFSIVLPEMIQSINRLINLMPSAFQNVIAWGQNLFEDNPALQETVNGMLLNMEDKVRSWVSTGLLPQLQSMMGQFMSIFGSAVTAIYDVIIGLIVCIYLLLDRKRLNRHAKAVLYAVFRPAAGDRLLREIRHTDDIFTGFFVGKLVDSAIVGAICYLFCFVLNMIRSFPNAILVSMVMGLTNIVPYFGPIVGGVICCLLILIVDPVNCLIFAIFAVVLQQADGNIIGPRILSGSVGLPGLWVLFSITLFGGLFGFVGILFGVPVFAVIYDAVRRFTRRNLVLHDKTEFLSAEDLAAVGYTAPAENGPAENGPAENGPAENGPAENGLAESTVPENRR